MASNETGARGRILDVLKRHGAQTVAQLAERLELTPMGIRQHMSRLDADGLVCDEPEETQGLGRPARLWLLTDEGARRFPESYADLALEMVDGVRAAFGEDGLARLVTARLEGQVKNYRGLLRGKGRELSKQVAALARQRTKEGYMAESRTQRDGSVLLVENNCPICAVAQVCKGICGAEEELFRRVLGGKVQVERTEHILDGSRRCVYRVSKA